MESRILGLLSTTLFLLLATAWATGPTPHCRCMSEVWTVKINMNLGWKKGNGGPGDSVQYATGIQYGDFNRGWFVSKIEFMPGGNLTIYQGLGDLFWYMKSAAGCGKVKAQFNITKELQCWFNQTGFEFKGTETLGQGTDLEVWQLHDKSSGIFMKEHLAKVSPDHCFPAYLTFATTTEGFASVQSALYTDYQRSVDDPSIFDLPDECKNAVLMPAPWSGAQAKTMSILAVVLIFVLHLGL